MSINASRSYYEGPMMVTLPATKDLPATEVHGWLLDIALQSRECPSCRKHKLAVCHH